MKKSQINTLKWADKIGPVAEQYKNLSAACDAALFAGCLDPNGMFYTAIWEAFTSLVKLIDVDGWIDWFVYETECGARPKEVVVKEDGNTTYMIDSWEKMAELMEIMFPTE
jgi:hypothetical protein